MIDYYFQHHPSATVTPWIPQRSSFIKAIKYNKLNKELSVLIGSKVYTYSTEIGVADRFSRSYNTGMFYDKFIKTKPKNMLKKLNFNNSL